MKRDQLRIDELSARIKKMEAPKAPAAAGGGDDSDDDDLEDVDGMKAEILELAKAQEKRQAKLDDYEKNKKVREEELRMARVYGALGVQS